MDDFHQVRRLGRGDVGSVQLVRLKGTNAFFAMKVLEKQEMQDRNKMHRVKAEDEILVTVDHPFLATLFTSFQTSSSLFFVMEYCSGGELFELLQKQPHKRFPEPTARFYGAEILLALQYLHLLGFVYRDLKPEKCACAAHTPLARRSPRAHRSVLLQSTGHVMLTDFDLSFCSSSRPFIQMPSGQDGASRLPMLVRPAPPPRARMCLHWALAQVAEPFAFTNSFVGTEEYLSPEARASSWLRDCSANSPATLLAGD